jgi:hypothetical protein
MPDRTAIVVSAIFASFLSCVALTTVAGDAAYAGDDCITEPKDQPSQGSHWYYHVDPVTHRKCWHQGTEGLTIHQVGSSKSSLSAKTISQQGPEVGGQQPTASSHTEQPIIEAQPTASGLTGQSTPETSTDAAGAENPPQSIPSSRWPDQQSSADFKDLERGLARRAATDAGIDSQGRTSVFTRAQVVAAERPPEISTNRVLLALLVGALALSMATGRLIFKYAAARRPRRGDILDQRESAWKWTELSHTFSASDASTRQANVVCDLPEPRELSCATEELRQLLVQLVEHGTFSRWPHMPRRNVDPKFSPGGASGALGGNRRAAILPQHCGEFGGAHLGVVHRVRYEPRPIVEDAKPFGGVASDFRHPHQPSRRSGEAGRVQVRAGGDGW